MTYYNIIFNNMKRNFKNYYLYIMSTVFSVVIYYLFSSIKYNQQVLGAVHTSTKATGVFNATSYIVLLFSMVFIWYSNAFFIKNRKKEIALYSLMGLKKKKIGRMILVENIVVAIISLVIGIIIGTLFSKLFVMIILRLMNEFIYVKFMFSLKAAKDTIIFFIIIFLISSIHSYWIIYKVKLIELFISSKKREKTIKNRPIIAVISLALIIYGYYLSQNMLNEMFLANVFIVLATVIAGTYGLFSTFLVFLLKQLKRRKKIYYKGNNLLAISNVAYRIKSHTMILATIAVLSASTIASLGSVDSFYYDFKTNEKELYPYSYIYENKGEELNNKVIEAIQNNEDNKLLGSNVINRAEIEAKLNYNFKDNFVNEYFGSLRKYDIISNSKYNEIMKVRGLNNEVTLGDNECALTFSTTTYFNLNKAKGNTIDLVMGNEEKRELYIAKVYKQSMFRLHYDNSYIVVSDNLYNEAVKNGARISSIVGIKVSNQLYSKKLTDKIIDIVPENASLQTFYYHFKNSNETIVLLLFSAFFIGIVFLISTGSIIYFKLITEANDEKERYKILSKIGVSKKDITKSVRKQILLIFVLPFIVSLVHSSFALSAFNKLFNAKILTPVILTMVGYGIVYFIYYYLTVKYYKRIIMEK
ncbi:MAG: FtsX-like permease family protein [Vallitalea sp.]|nr:FtsX-like permease family protein [Vallitalea sp.]